MLIRKLSNIYLNAIASLFFCVSMSACTTPDERSFEDGWRVSRNQCGDVSAAIRAKEVHETSINRDITFLDQQSRKIATIAVHVTRSGRTITSKTYDNDLSNRENSVKKIQRNQIGGELKEAIDTYFDQPGKYEEIDQVCLLKGFSNA